MTLATPHVPVRMQGRRHEFKAHGVIFMSKSPMRANAQRVA